MPVLAALIAWCLQPHARAADRSSLTNFDQRISAAKAAAQPPEQAAAGARLKEALPNIAIDFDPLTGSPKWVRSPGGLLSGPDGQGGAISAKSAQQYAGDPDKPVKAFLDDHRALFRHGAEAIAGAIKKREHRAQGILRNVTWQQQVGGIPVFESVLVANMTLRGELVTVASHFIPEPDKAADRATPNWRAKARPAIDAEEAVRRSVTNAAEEVQELAPLDQPAPITLKQRFLARPLPDEATAELTWLPLDGERLRLCWVVELTRRDHSERFRFLVDSETGEIIIRRKLTLDSGEAIYRVYTGDSPSPFSPAHAVPTNSQPPFVERDLFLLSSVNPSASPLGWVGGNRDLRGNNVDARLDRDADNRPDLPRVEGTLDSSNRLVFDFPLDVTQHPTNFGAAAVAQLFYWCNWMHDRLYEIGFTESAGNYQKDNFGRGGLDNDAMLADAQDGSGFNNANFTPAPDGLPGRIQMFLFNGPNPPRDGDLDAEVILHEYAHGMSERLVGGGPGMTQLQSYGMGEGWSDFIAKALLAHPGHDLGGNYAMGGYVTYQYGGLAQNYYYGIRRYPYSTNMNVNPLTFKDIDPNRASTHPGVPRNPIIVSLGNEVHRQGEVWGAMLWDMRANLLTKYAPTNAFDYTNANQKILRYVTLGMLLAPVNPNFAQARDGIVMAARLTPGSGNDTNEIWAAFARRGLGRSAICPDSSTTFGVIEAYDTPSQPEFSVVPPQALVTAFAGPLGGPFLPDRLTNTLVSGALTNLPWAASVNQPWLQLSTMDGFLPARGSADVVLSLTPAAAALGPGTHQAIVYFTNIVRTQVISRVYSVRVDSGEPPEPMTVTPKGPLAFRSQDGKTFDPEEQVYRLANNTTQPLAWQAFSTNSWLTVGPGGGTLAATPDIKEVTVNVNTTNLANGIYFGAVTFMTTNGSNRVDIPVTLRVGGRDYLSRKYTNIPFPLAFSSLTFTPDASEDMYRVCRDPALAFPTNPTNGTVVTLADDEYKLIALTNGATVSLFGISSNLIYIGANGNLTFDPGVFIGSFHPGEVPYFDTERAAALYGDLNPGAGGTVSYLQLSNRLVVTYQNVPEYGTLNSNDFQIEMFYDGRIRFTWLRIDFAMVAFGGDPMVGLSSGGGVPAEWIQSNFEAAPLCSPPIALIVPARATEGDGSLHGSIIFSMPLTNDIHVTLTSSDPDEVAVPESLVLTPFPGQTVYEFGLAVIDDGFPDGTQPATITAGFETGSINAKMLVDDAEFGVLSISVTPTGVEGSTILGGGTVTANVVAQKPITVQLQSDLPSRLLVPPNVVIPAGSSSASFDIMLPENSLLDGLERAIIEASVVNWFGDLDAVQVTDNESRALQVLLPPDVLEGDGLLLNTGRVSFAGLPTSNVVIHLESERPDLIWVQPTVTNLAGQSSVRFSISVGSNAVIDTDSSVQIFARATGFIDGVGAVEWVDDERPFVPSNPTPSDSEGSVRRDITLAWAVNNHAPTTTVYHVYLSTNAALSGLNPIVSTTDHTATLPFQLDPDTTYYWQVIGRLDPLPAVESPVWSFTTASLAFQFGDMESPRFIGEPFPVRIEAIDQYGLGVTNYRGAVTLTNEAPVKSTDSIVITEMDTVPFGRVEFANVSGKPIDIAGWQISLYDSINWPNPAVVYTVPGPSVAGPTDLFNLRSLPLPLFPGRYPNFATGTNVSWNNNPVDNPVAVLLRDNVGNIVDFACAADANPAHISVPAAIPSEHWVGAPVRVNIDSSFTYQRIGNVDRNSSNDWTIAKWSVMTNNAGFIAPFTNKIAIPFSVTTLNNFVQGVSTGTVTMFDEARGVRLGLTDGAGHGALSEPFDVLVRNDLGLDGTVPSVVLVDQPLVCQLAITNTGPAAASGVQLHSRLDDRSAFSSATASQGSCSFSNGTVLCDLGTLEGGASASIAIATRPLARGTVTNLAWVTRSDADGYLPNNTVQLSSTVIYPQVSVFDITNAEPVTGSATMTFTLRLSAPNTLTSSVVYATSDGTATAGADYTGASGVVVFPPGSTNATIPVTIHPDLLNEFNETVFVSVLSATNLDIIRAFGVGTINDNDSLPGVYVTDAVAAEPATGTTSAVFTVTLDAPSGRTVTLAYSTANALAVAGLDYVETYGNLVLPPGTTNGTIQVPILDDSFAEPSKTFRLNLVNAGNVIVKRSPGVGTILDNDVAGIERFTFEPLTGTHHVGASLPISVTAREGTGAVATEFNEPVRLLAFESPRTVAIGSSNLLWDFPFGASFHDSRLQSIYHTNEIGPAASIVGVALEVETTPAQTLNQWTIRMRHTGSPHYLSAAWESAGWVTNSQHNLTLVSNGWVTFPFSNPFPYNGRDHVMIDFSFNNAAFSADGFARSTPTLLPRSLHLRSDSAVGLPLDWSGSAPTGTIASRVLNVRFIVARNIPLQPAVLTNFVNGVALNAVTLAAPATNLVLRAVDRAGHMGDSAPFTSAAFDIVYLQRTASTVMFRFPTLPSRKYVVESRPNLGVAWTPASTVITGDGELALFVQSAPPEQHFYRVRLVE